jgi:transcriptional regulator GlxA family with amidase domain
MDTKAAIETPFRVGFVLLDGFALMSYASAVEPLRAANLITGQNLYEVKNLPISGARTASSSGAIIGANAFLGEQVDFDLVLVVAGGELRNLAYPRLYHWLNLLASRGVLIGGVSGGPLLLACAGVMRGRRMTLHWEHAPRVESLSNQLIVERSLYVWDRDRLTCAGGTAALDMMQSLIAEQQGAELARKISDWFVHTDIRPGERPQQAGIAQRFDLSDPTVIRAVQAMENHLADPLTLTQLSDIVDVGVRQLNRLFQQHLQISTLAFYRQLRLRKARSLLSDSSLSVSGVAQSTGFANGAHLSKQFRAFFSLSPTAYRKSQQGTT